MVLVHGMGACHEHYNKLLAELDTRQYTAYAVDLLGFGDSDKPRPSLEAEPRGHLYNYDTWSQQIQDFVAQVRAHVCVGLYAFHRTHRGRPRFSGSSVCMSVHVRGRGGA